MTSPLSRRTTLPQPVVAFSRSICLLVFIALPASAFAAASPFDVGTTALSDNLLAILTPVAVIAVMALGVAAWFNVVRWSWFVSSVAGIVLVFGAGQMVGWIRGLFGV